MLGQAIVDVDCEVKSRQIATTYELSRSRSQRKPRRILMSVPSLGQHREGGSKILLVQHQKLNC